MITTQKSLILCALSFFLICHCVPIAHADDPPLYDAFQKCDGLLGKSTKAVLDVLGQPDEASPIGDPRQPEHIIYWTYKAKGDFRHSLGLLFSPTKGLAVAMYAGLDNPLVSGNTQDPSDLVRLLASYNAGSLMFGYDPGDFKGTAQMSYHNVVFKATTPNGNLFRVFPRINAPSVLISKRTFNAAKGVYTNSFVANPNFVISDFNSIGPAFLFSPHQMVAGNPDKLPPRWIALCLPGAQGGYDFTKKNYMPLTSKIAPWLHPK